MKITIPFKSFDIKGILHTVADFSDATCGEDFQAATLATETEREELYDQDWDNLPRFEREHRFPELEAKLKVGETLVLDVSEPYVGEPVNFVDGSEYDLSEDEEFHGGETDCAVLFLDYNLQTGNLTIESGMLCGDGCSCPPSLDRGSICSLDKAAEEFVKRFIRP